MIRNRGVTFWFFLVLFWGVVQEGTGVAQDIQLPAQPLEGQRLFVSKGCIKCHSVFGEGGTIGADLGRTQAGKKTMDIVAAMWNHSWEMARALLKGEKIPQLSPPEMASILSFLYYLKYFDEPGSPEKGEVLFREKGCIKCHSIAGEGGKVGPALDTLSVYASPVFLAQEMWNHGKRMVQEMKKTGVRIPTFKKNEMADILAYLHSTSSLKPTSPIYLFPGSPQRGAQLFREKGCANCHQTNGEGRKIGPNLGEKRFHRGVVEIAGRLWNHGPKMWARMEKEGIPQPIFSGNEMADIIAFLYFLEFRVKPGNIERGRRIFQEKGCQKCHAINNEGDKVGPNLAETKGLDNLIAISSAMWNHNIKMQEEMKKQNVPFPRFTGDELADLLGFIRSLREQSDETK